MRHVRTPPTPIMSTVTSTSTSSTRNSNLQPRRESSRTGSSLSPFFTHLDDHTSTTSSVHTSSATHSPDLAENRESIPWSSLSSDPSDEAADQEFEDESVYFKCVPSRPRTPVSAVPLLQRASSREKGRSDGPASFSAVARRQLSKLSFRGADMDNDSVISEPVSYSNAYVASEVWLVQRDVEPAEQEVVERERRRRRERIEQLNNPSFLRSAKAETCGRWGDGYDAASGSSLLVDEFFAGRLPPSVGAMSGRTGVAEGAGGIEMGRHGGSGARVVPQHSDAFSAIYSYGRYYDADDWREPLKKTGRGNRYREQEFGPRVRRRFFAARRFRWWLRRMTHRARDDWEYV